MTRSLPLLLLALVTSLLTACGVRPSVPITGDPAPSEKMAEGAVLYLLAGATLTRVVRPPAQNPATTNLDLLAAGPTREELAEGLTTEVPPDVAPITRIRTTAGLTVRVSSALAQLSPLARSQLVCTATPPDRDPPMPVTLADPTGTLPPQQCPFTA